MLLFHFETSNDLEVFSSLQLEAALVYNVYERSEDRISLVRDPLQEGPQPIGARFAVSVQEYQDVTSRDPRPRQPGLHQTLPGRSVIPGVRLRWCNGLFRIGT